MASQKGRHNNQWNTPEKITLKIVSFYLVLEYRSLYHGDETRWVTKRWIDLCPWAFEYFEDPRKVTDKCIAGRGQTMNNKNKASEHPDNDRKCWPYRGLARAIAETRLHLSKDQFEKLVAHCTLNGGLEKTNGPRSLVA